MSKNWKWIIIPWCAQQTANRKFCNYIFRKSITSLCMQTCSLGAFVFYERYLIFVHQSPKKARKAKSKKFQFKLYFFLLLRKYKSKWSFFFPTRSLVFFLIFIYLSTKRKQKAGLIMPQAAKQPNEITIQLNYNCQMAWASSQHER